MGIVSEALSKELEKKESEKTSIIEYNGRLSNEINRLSFLISDNLKDIERINNDLLQLLAAKRYFDNDYI